MKKSTTLSLCLVFFFCFRASSQDTTVFLKDMTAISAEINTVSLKVEKLLKSNLQLYNSMKSELTEISKLKRIENQEQALKTYRTKYLERYTGIIRDAGIDMQAVVGQLNLDFPRFNFTINNDFGIVAKYKSPYKKNYKSETVAAMPKKKRITKFLESKRIDCSLLHGSEVTFKTKSLKAFGAGVLVGMCDVIGELKKTIQRPSNSEKVTLNLEGKVEARPAAMGTIGMAGCAVDSDVVVLQDGEFVIFESERPIVFALIGWYVSQDLSHEFSHSIDVSGMTSLEINLKGLVIANALLGAARGTSKVKLTKAELVYD